MKTAKLVIGVLSIVLTMVVLFQSCAATVGDALANEGGTSGGVGMAVALLMLVAGIVAIAARNSRGGSIFCIIAYALAGVYEYVHKNLIKHVRVAFYLWNCSIVFYDFYSVFCFVFNKFKRQVEFVIYIR